MFEILKEKVGVIYTIANLRNLGSHGQTSNEKQMRSLSNEEIEMYFTEFNEFSTVLESYPQIALVTAIFWFNNKLL